MPQATSRLPLLMTAHVSQRSTVRAEVSPGERHSLPRRWGQGLKHLPQ